MLPFWASCHEDSGVSPLQASPVPCELPRRVRRRTRGSPVAIVATSLLASRMDRSNV